MKTYEVAAEALFEQGARTIFGLMGDANLAYIGAYVENQGGEFVAAVAEGSAVSMADGFHRMTGEVGVASVTHGPAVTNCLTALTEAVRARSEVLPSGAQVVTDVGRFSFAAWKHLDVTPGRFTVPGTFGSIGLGIGTAVGAAAARRDVPTVCIAGDGGGMMGILELSTAVRYELPLVVVILNDNCYGAEYRKLAELGLNTKHSEVAWPEFAEVGRSLGAQAVTVREEKDLTVAAEAIVNGAFPLLIEIKADPARRTPEKNH